MIRKINIFQVSLVGMLVSVAILYFALPRAVAVSIALPGNRIADALFKGEPLGREEIQDLADNREHALMWAADPALSLELSEIYHTLWVTAPATKREFAVMRTRAETIHDLTARPLIGRGWWRLALADTVVAGRLTDLSRRALLMSVAVQPNAMSLVPARLRLLLRYWLMFSYAERAALKPQFVEAWRRDPATVIALARNDFYRSVIRGALAANPRILGSFEEVYMKQLTKPEIDPH